MKSGFKEIEHTADWAIDVWAPNLPGFLLQAAAGMYHLMGISPCQKIEVTRVFLLEYLDNESLLVDFLGELLYLLESEGFACSKFAIETSGDQFYIHADGWYITEEYKEIKAVTFSGLKIIQVNGMWSGSVVFDV